MARRELKLKKKNFNFLIKKKNSLKVEISLYIIKYNVYTFLFF